jgi:hypothetical protein
VVRVRNTLAPPGLVAPSSRERLSRAELERRVIGQLVNQMAELRTDSDAWTSLILDVKNMAVEKDLPASIVDHVRAALRAMETSGDGHNVLREEPGALEDEAEGASLGI